MVKIAVDINEKAVYVEKKLSEMNAEVVKMSLPVGDYLVADDTIVERKTVSDFISSIYDKRIFTQLECMKKCFDSSVLVIEGDESLCHSKRIHENGVIGVISKIALDYKIPIIRTAGEEETAKYIYSFAKRKQNNNNPSFSIDFRKKSKSSRENILVSLPGVGVKIAFKLLKHFGSVENVFMAGEDELIQVSSIGKKKAKQIRKLLTKEYICR
ncbi:MAG: ERCC4 domain-containing protein [Candidatus Nanoarchaeia archaeon]|nr:ERCC4 domain-containing protein [Candidatus Nanoarchaeia archaeon]